MLSLASDVLLLWQLQLLITLASVQQPSVTNNELSPVIWWKFFSHGPTSYRQLLSHEDPSCMHLGSGMQTPLWIHCTFTASERCQQVASTGSVLRCTTGPVISLPGTGIEQHQRVMPTSIVSGAHAYFACSCKTPEQLGIHGEAPGNNCKAQVCTPARKLPSPTWHLLRQADEHSDRGQWSPMHVAAAETC